MEIINNKIPIEFLIDRFGIEFKIDNTDTDIRIRIKSTTKNLQSYLMLNKEIVEMNVYSGFYSYGSTQVSIVGHHIITTLVKMFPHFGRLDIDYTNLEKYLKKDFVEK
jgi:hypothetical protein